MTEKETINDGVVEEFYDNGQLKYRGNNKDGYRHGLWETFYLSNNNPFVLHGPINTRGNYKDWELEGLWEEFHKNGQLRSRRNCINGEQHGLWEYFDEEGNPTNTEEYKDGELVE